MTEKIKKIFVLVLLGIFLLSTTGVFFIVNHCEARQATEISLKEKQGCCKPVEESSCCSGHKKSLQKAPISSAGSLVFQASKCCTSASLYKKLTSAFLPENYCFSFCSLFSSCFYLQNSNIIPPINTFHLFNDVGPPVLKTVSDIILKTSCMLL